jgi:membrane protease YdiL (CAAX protease family)
VIWLYAALLVVWGNVLSSLLGASSWLPGGSWEFAAAGAVLVAASVVVARALGLDASDLGSTLAAATRGTLIGAALGAAAAVASLALLRVVAPLIVGRDVDYAPLRLVTESDLIRHIAVLLPLGDIVPEELAFRGVLLGGLVRRYGARIGVLGSAVCFALWHLAVASVTVGDTTLARPSLWFLPAVAAALLAVLAGGVVFAWLRLRTASLATTIAAHWLFNAVLLAGLWSTRPPVPSGCC